VHTGQAVSAGQDLCVLVNHELLYIEALAFEQDASFVLRAQEKHWPMQAVLNSNGDTHDELNDLQIEFVASNIDVQSRTLKFYLPVRNELLRDETDAAGRRYIMWKYRPGQRMTLRVPVEKFDQQIVVPVDAVADDGAESFVFLENGDGFDQVAVHVLHRDRHSIVIANDGSLFPGDRIAMKSAHQIQMAIRNQTVGGIDPHAGHSH
jgi:cobalt-zinc-cadmium efflux system membrane fusion protein